MQTGRNGSYTRGMLVMAASSVAFSAGSLLVPLTRGVDTSIVASARFVIGALAILGMGALRLVRIKPVNWLWLMGRGLFGAASVYLMYYGIVRLGLGTGTILGYTYPIFAALLAPFMIGERLHGDVLAAVVISFLGIWLVLSPVAPWDLVRGIGAAGAAEPAEALRPGRRSVGTRSWRSSAACARPSRWSPCASCRRPTRRT